MAVRSAKARLLDEGARVLQALDQVRRRATADRLEVPAVMEAPVPGAPVTGDERPVWGLPQPQLDATGVVGHAVPRRLGPPSAEDAAHDLPRDGAAVGAVHPAHPGVARRAVARRVP